MYLSPALLVFRPVTTLTSLLLLLLLAATTGVVVDASGGGKKGGGNHDGGGLSFLEGTWYTCESDWAYFTHYPPVGGNFYFAYEENCEAGTTLGLKFLNPTQTGVLGEFAHVDGTACQEFDIDPCPNANGVEGAAMVRFFPVGTWSKSKRLRETLVLIADYEEYLDDQGEWQTATSSGVTDIERLTCDIKGSDYDTLYCDSEKDWIRSDTSMAITASFVFVRDLDHCSACTGHY
mmetsp:Transcript_24765/g.56744  ORF Transcript_24765/g.56744 Transcript_24765/m.56744 type:complete len:234 (-) Transcript_24765:110-811(-)